MTPILFSENSTSFTTNGIGRLSDAVSCYVEEGTNGIYELTLEYPSSGRHFSDLVPRNIIVALPAKGKTIQPFRIYDVSKPINGIVTVSANHMLKADLAKNTCMPFSVSASSSACNTALQGLKTNAVETCSVTFWTDVNTVAAYSQTTPMTILKRLGGVEGSILDQFGGEYEWDVNTVKLHKNRGSLKNIPLRYGKNIIDIKQETNISETVTGIVPFWVDQEGGEIVTLTEKAVYSSHASDYSSPLTVPMDFSDQFENKPTQATLRAAAQAYVAQSNFGVPKVSTDINFVDLADTEEYKDLLNLQNVYLCDTIPVIFEKLGIETTAKIVKVKFDVLKEKYTSITVGSLKSDLSSTITDQAASITSLSERVRMNFSQVDDDIATSINNATAWLTTSGGYVIANKNNDGTWKELLFLDTNSTSTAVNVLRINQNGIGFSSNGVAGPYTQAWTLDGKLVIGGTNVPSITVYDNNNNIIFKADATAMIWNATNSSMDANGNITASGATLTNCTISSTQSSKTIQIKNGQIQFGSGSSSNASIYGNANSIQMYSPEILMDLSGQGHTWSSDTAMGIYTNSGDVDIGTSFGNLNFECDNITVSENGTLHEGFSGSFSLRNSSGGTATMNFVNGLLVLN